MRLRRLCGPVVAVLLSMAPLLGLPAPVLAAPGDFAYFPQPDGLPKDSSPLRITTGPDGMLWFTERGSGHIGQMTPDGVLLNEYGMSPGGSAPYAITVGPDNDPNNPWHLALWFTEPAYFISKITPAGDITRCDTFGDGPDITAGPDGNLWATGSARIRRITPDCVITEYPAPGGTSGITAGPDNNLWFTVAFDEIDRMDPSTGVITGQFKTPTPGSDPQRITVGPDGNLWFTEHSKAQIGRLPLLPDGGVGVIKEFATLRHFGPLDITAGPDGNLWFTQGPAGIGRVTTEGVMTDYDTVCGCPNGITAGPDGNLWFTENNNFIGRLETPLT